VQITFENDEFEEKLMYLEQKYHALIKRMGASQEDIDAIEEEIMLKNDQTGARKSSGGVPSQKRTFGRRRGSSAYNNRQSRVSGPGANQISNKLRGGHKMEHNSDNVDEYGEEIVGGDNQVRKGADNNRRGAGA